MKDFAEILCAHRWGSPMAGVDMVDGKVTDVVILECRLCHEVKREGALDPYVVVGWIDNGTGEPTLQKP